MRTKTESGPIGIWCWQEWSGAGTASGEAYRGGRDFPATSCQGTEHWLCHPQATARCELGLTGQQNG
ncbi:MAG: hypothetical protein HOC20_03680 [Chloroflexi bacterium]|nr:hypothetical protein [Chloroflexota bacterium]